jgi:hypothetical protein
MKTKLSLLVIMALFSFSANAQDYCLQFNGVDQRVFYADDATLDIMDGATSYTIEAWIYPTGTTVNNKVVMKRFYQYAITLFRDAATPTEGDDTDSGRRFYFTHYDGLNPGVTTTYYNTTDNAITLNQWNHIAVICDGATTKLYANGVDVSLGTNPAQKPMAVVDAAITNANFYFGGVTGAYFPGYIDKVRVIKEAVPLVNLNSSLVTGPAYTTNANTSVLFNVNEGSGSTTDNEASTPNGTLQCAGATCSTIPFVSLASLSVESNAVSNFNIYPNPVIRAELFITPKNNDSIQKVTISDMSGKIVKSLNPNSSEPIEINTTGMNSGVYLVNIKSATSSETKRIIIK